MSKDKFLQAKSQKLQSKSESNPRRHDTFTERVAGSWCGRINLYHNIHSSEV